jgi:hypothetical protein
MEPDRTWELSPSSSSSLVSRRDVACAERASSSTFLCGLIVTKISLNQDAGWHLPNPPPNPQGPGSPQLLVEVQGLIVFLSDDQINWLGMLLGVQAHYLIRSDATLPLAVLGVVSPLGDAPAKSGRRSQDSGRVRNTTVTLREQASSRYRMVYGEKL